jgi:acetyl esterase/lipase
MLAACGQSAPDASHRARSAPASSPPVTSGPHAKETVRDVSYGSDPLQRLDIYLPGGEGPHPVMMYLHSGGWVAGSHEYIPDFVLDQVDRGIALVAVDYRLSSRDRVGTPIDAFPVPDQDVDQAIRFVRAHGAAWHLDPDAIVLAGASAGGHLALLAAAAPGRYVAPDLPADLRDVSPRVQGVMAFVAPSDMVAFIAEDMDFAEIPASMFLACPLFDTASCDTGRAAEASPATHLDPGAPPAYFEYGTQDTLAPVATQGLPIAAAWAAARGEPLGTEPSSTAPVQLHVEAAGHNLDRGTVDLPDLEAWLDSVLAARSADSLAVERARVRTAGVATVLRVLSPHQSARQRPPSKQAIS